MKTSILKILESIRCSRILPWIPVVLFAGFIFYLSSLSDPQVPRFRLADRIYHLGLYAGFGLLVGRAMRRTRERWSGGRILLVTLVTGFLYGVTDEIHQSFVPGRSPEWWDLLMDGMGGLLGGQIYLTGLYVKEKGK